MSFLMFNRKQHYCFLRPQVGGSAVNARKKHLSRLMGSAFSYFHLQRYLKWLMAYQPGNIEDIPEKFKHYRHSIVVQFVFSAVLLLLLISILFLKLSVVSPQAEVGEQGWDLLALGVLIFFNFLYTERVGQKFTHCYKKLNSVNHEISVPSNLDWFQQDQRYTLSPTPDEEKMYFNGLYLSEELIEETPETRGLLSWLSEHPQTSPILKQWETGGRIITHKELLALLRAKQWLSQTAPF